jgi:hypothetical protein
MSHRTKKTPRKHFEHHKLKIFYLIEVNMKKGIYKVFFCDYSPASIIHFSIFLPGLGGVTPV